MIQANTIGADWWDKRGALTNAEVTSLLASLFLKMFSVLVLMRLFIFCKNADLFLSFFSNEAETLVNKDDVSDEVSLLGGDGFTMIDLAGASSGRLCSLDI